MSVKLSFRPEGRQLTRDDIKREVNNFCGEIYPGGMFDIKLTTEKIFQIVDKTLSLIGYDPTEEKQGIIFEGEDDYIEIRPTFDSTIGKAGWLGRWE